MKAKYFQLIIYSLTMLLSVGLFSCSSSNNDEPTTLDDVVINDLLQLREEEKLARDVYIYAYDKYSLEIANNISQSEQTHMDKVLTLLDKYELEDPAKSENGVFSNEELQTLYAQLTAKVDLSLLDSLVVGAMIEDLDIKDIEDFLEHTTESEIVDVYKNLQCGSRNHLRSYYSTIVSNGGSYSPIYISQDEFESIINSENETCGSK